MITVVGSLNMDVVIRTTYFPNPGETISSQTYGNIPGGKGANQAVTIGKLGGKIHMIGAIGADGFGKQLLACLEASHVHISAIKECPEANTGTAFINVTESGENKIILVAGANALVTKADIDRHMKLIEDSELVITQLEIPLETVAYTLEKASSLGKTTILNPAPAVPLSPSILRSVSILTPNETELALLTGLKTDTLEEIEKAAKVLLSQGVKVVVVTIGKKGAVIVTPEKTTPVAGYEVTALDTTAAGDSFTGALALSLEDGNSIEQAVNFANKVASIVVQRQGAQTSIPTLEELSQF